MIFVLVLYKETMESSIDTIRRFAKLTGNYSNKPEDLVLKTETNGISTIGLTQKELENYVVYPIVSADSEKTTYISKPENIKFVNDDTFRPTISMDLKTLTVNNGYFSKLTTNDTEDSSDLKLSDNIIIKCVNADVPAEIPKENFWCRAFDKTYIQKYDITPISSGGKYLWYYGKKKIGSKGGHPRHRTTFRQRRLKRTAAKSPRRRRATRRTRRRV